MEEKYATVQTLSDAFIFSSARLNSAIWGFLFGNYWKKEYLSFDKIYQITNGQVPLLCQWRCKLEYSKRVYSCILFT